MSLNDHVVLPHAEGTYVGMIHVLVTEYNRVSAEIDALKKANKKYSKLRKEVHKLGKEVDKHQKKLDRLEERSYELQRKEQLRRQRQNKASRDYRQRIKARRLGIAISTGKPTGI